MLLLSLSNIEIESVCVRLRNLREFNISYPKLAEYYYNCLIFCLVRNLCCQTYSSNIISNATWTICDINETVFYHFGLHFFVSIHIPYI